MKIALLSDIHDHVWNLAKVLSHVKEADAMICCGDLCSPFVLKQLAEGFPGRPLHVVFGNNDADTYRMMAISRAYPDVTMHGALWRGEIGNKRFAVNHYDDIASTMIGHAEIDVICYGHDHTFTSRKNGNQLILNPGAVMGYKPGEQPATIPATFMMYDVSSHRANGYALGEEGVQPFYGSSQKH